MRVALYFVTIGMGWWSLLCCAQSFLVTGEGWWCVLVELGWFGVLGVVGILTCGYWGQMV